MTSTQVVPDTHSLEIPEGFGLLSAIDESGDTRMQWDKNDPEQVARAKARFEEYTKLTSQGGKGYLAYRWDSKGKKGAVINTFDPSAERIIMVPPMIGG